MEKSTDRSSLKLHSKLSPKEKSKKRQTKSAGNSKGEGEKKLQKAARVKKQKIHEMSRKPGTSKRLKHSSGASTDHNTQASLAPAGLLVIGCSCFRCCPGESHEGDKLGELGERENENTAPDTTENLDHSKKNQLMVI